MITPDGTTAYVASWQAGTVTPIATATNTAGTAIDVGEGARAVAITPDGKSAYVVVWGEPGTIVPIATATNTAGRPIQVGAGPCAIAITPGSRGAAARRVAPSLLAAGARAGVGRARCVSALIRG